MEELHQKILEAPKDANLEASEWFDRKWVTARFKEGKIDWEVRAREGFHPVEEIKRVEGPTIEVAGPTDEGFFFHDIRKNITRPGKLDLFKEREVFVSNLYPGRSEFAMGKFNRFVGMADFIADARELPIKEGRVAALFCSCLGQMGQKGREEMRRLGFEKTALRLESEKKAASGRNRLENSIKGSTRLREEVIQEVQRVLKEGGLLVWQGGMLDDLKFALNNGFILLQIEQRKTVSGGELSPKMIFQKRHTIKEK
ncbi:MAG: hypothetical protein Q7R91_02840 [bacterium]|nr:hypothetical protein [bacterium]